MGGGLGRRVLRDGSEGPGHQPRLLRGRKRTAADGPEGGTGDVPGESAEAGAAEIAVVTGHSSPLAHSAALIASVPTTDKGRFLVQRPSESSVVWNEKHAISV